MGEPPSRTGAPEPLECALTDADDRLRLDHWTPPQAGIIPRVRLGQRWISVLWALPISERDDRSRSRSDTRAEQHWPVGAREPDEREAPQRCGGSEQERLQACKHRR